MVIVGWDYIGYGDWVVEGVFTDMKKARAKTLEWALGSDLIDEVLCDEDLEDGGFEFTEVSIDEWIPVQGDKDFVGDVD
jgi:hypothetical protein